MTDLKYIKKQALLLLGLPIEEPRILGIVSHPFASSIVDGVTVNGEIQIVNLTDENDLKIWREQLTNIIESKTSLFSLFSMIRKPYRLFFLDLIQDEITKNELGELLNDFWSTVENISTDVNVSSKDLIKLFKKADKSSLMDSEEIATYNALPKVVTLYRGVTGYNKENKKALSWTSDKEQALWFANRFQNEERELWTIHVPREKVLACYKYENEHIVDLCSGDTNIEIEVV